MNEQIKKDEELLATWHLGKNLMGRIISMSAEDGDALLAAQARVTETRVREREVLNIGKYELIKTPRGLWIQHESGEGGSFDEVAFEEAIDEFYKINF